MDERFVEVEVVESKNVKIGEGEKLVLDKAKYIVYVPFMTLEGFEHFYGKLEEHKEN